MKLLNRSLARSLWFFPTEDLNPCGLDLIPVYAAIQSRYRFQVYPNKPEDISPAPNGIQYGKGAYRLEDGQQIEIVNFTIYNDGLVADTRYSTATTDQFLGDVLAFVSNKHGLAYDPSMVKKRAYVSELVVTSNLDLEIISPHFRRFSEMLATATGRGIAFSPVSVKFGIDPASPGSQLVFSFERRVGSPFEDNRYFTIAPVGTEKHLELLDAFERMMTE